MPDAQCSAIQLYYFPGTRAQKVRWMLEELNLNYDLKLVDLRQSDHKKPDHLKRQPLGKVPVLTIDESVIYESVGICLYLADRFWQKMLAPVPEDHQQRAKYYTWVAFSMATLETAVLEQHRQQKILDANNQQPATGPAFTEIDDILKHIDRTLTRSPYIMGDGFSVVDILNGAPMIWANSLGLVAGYQHIQSWLDRLQSRPAYLKSKQFTLP